MAAQASIKTQKVILACPHCGHKQPEPPTAYSTVCKKCSQYFRIHDALNPVAKAEELPKDDKRKQVACFKCGADLLVPPAAQSTMCKKCSSHVDLRDYQITNATSKNFKTKGRFVIEEGAFLFNTESIVGEAILRGRLLGKLTAERSLEIFSTAEIKGSFKTARLIIPLGNRFLWPETIQLGEAEIVGELIADVQAQGTVRIRSTARLFGNVQAGALLIEEGAVFVGMAKIAAH
jgi:cytoskeletal protein CcmA (bactofilin family)